MERSRGLPETSLIRHVTSILRFIRLTSKCVVLRWQHVDTNHTNWPFRWTKFPSFCRLTRKTESGFTCGAVPVRLLLLGAPIIIPKWISIWLSSAAIRSIYWVQFSPCSFLFLWLASSSKFRWMLGRSLVTAWRSCWRLPSTWRWYPTIYQPRQPTRHTSVRIYRHFSWKWWTLNCFW